MLRLLERFGLGPGRPAPELALPGSPERCVERAAVLDADGRPWMLERLHPSQAPRREELAALLTALCAASPVLAGLIPAPRRAEGGGFVPSHAGWCWQLSPYVAGTPLPRPDYLDQAWRGEAVAEFLAALSEAGQRLPVLPPAPEPDLMAYADGLFAALDRHAPRLTPRLARLRLHLRGLPELLAAQPVTLAHGDLHPLNVIWGQGRMNAVIDWEFAGARPLLYDAANCLGCAGFEHPSGLGRAFAAGLVGGLKRGLRTRGAEGVLELLPAMVPVTRLGWLSEWLRKGEADLVTLELDYLDLLLDALPGAPSAGGF